MAPPANLRGRSSKRWSSNRPRGNAGRRNTGRRSSFKDSRLADVNGADDAASLQEAPDTDVSNGTTSESEGENTSEPFHATAFAVFLDSFTDRSMQPVSKKRKIEASVRIVPQNNTVVTDRSEEKGDDNGSTHSEPTDFVDDGEDDQSENLDPGQLDISGNEHNGDTDTMSTDPFVSHFSAPNEEDVLQRLRIITNNKCVTRKRIISHSREIFTLPQLDYSDGDKDWVKLLPAPIHHVQDLHLKKRLKEGMMKSKRIEFDATERLVAPLLHQYFDLLFCERTATNADSLRRMAALHATNHVFKTRDKIIKNNAKISKKDDHDYEECRDQGFTRPKVLILLPTRQSCLRMVEAICAICQPEQQENRKRFDDSYIDEEVKFSDDRPADFRELFSGNDDDMFRLGLKFTRNSIKYFAQFYNSDIILASPLGLRMAMGSDDKVAPSNKKGSQNELDYDFLSSIELVIVDQADALLMQNWEHVEYIFEHLNLHPRDTHGSDFNRVRTWYLDGLSRNYRQTVIFSAFHTPALAELFRRHCTNWAGKVRIQPAEYAGLVGQLRIRGIKQTFSRFDSVSIGSDPDARFDFFIKAVLPTIIKARHGGGSGGSSIASRGGGVLVFVPSYLDFVRVRNWFATSAIVANVSFGTISEYSSVQEASRAKSHFLTGRHSVLLYTERAHHFRRHQLSGARTVILYGLPDNPIFYSELTGDFLARSQRNHTQDDGQGNVLVMFSRYDMLKLERIVGSQRATRMVHERSDTFIFEEKLALD